MSWFTGKSKNALVVMPENEPPRGSTMDPNGNSPIHQASAQQVSSLGLNQTFKIKFKVTPDGAEWDFSKTAHQPMVRPMAIGPEVYAAEPERDDLKKLKKELKKLRLELERAKFEHVKTGGRMDVNGIPCMLQKTANGYDLMRIGPDGQLEFVAHYGGPV